MKLDHASFFSEATLIEIGVYTLKSYVANFHTQMSFSQSGEQRMLFTSEGK